MSNLHYITGLTGLSHFEAPAVDAMTPRDIQPETELLEIMTGGTVFFDGRKWEKGTIFWHISGDCTIHKTCREDPYRCMVFRFSCNRDVRTFPRVSTWQNIAQMDEFFAQVMHHYYTERLTDLTLAQYIYSRISWEVTRSQHSSRENYPKQLSQALHYIRENLTSAFGLDDLADYAGISKPYLFSLFKQYLDDSPHKYINTYRINHACSLLTGSDKAIKEVADECGFSSLISFYRLFKKQHKISPGLYREQNFIYHHGTSAAE